MPYPLDSTFHTFKELFWQLNSLFPHSTKAGYTVSQIELQYVTRPTKTLPCRHFEFIEPFTPDDLDKITNQLQLIAESVHLWNTHPQYRYLLAQDYRLKTPSKPTLFI